jgi:hypothetical protein
VKQPDKVICMAIRRNGPPDKPFCVVDNEGNRIACHATEEAAQRQLSAIEAAKHARGDREDEFVTRLDFGRLGKAQRTPSGGVRVPAHLTRTGVFTYTKADGTPFRELRHPDEVFNPDSLASLAGAPVTDLHPGQMVAPSNWRNLSIGHVGERVDKKKGEKYDFVHAKLFIQDEKAIAAVEKGDRQEISMGYTCRLEMTPGEHNGEKYDAVQRTIRYNHAAIGPIQWGRAGAEVGLRLDSLNHCTLPATPDNKPEEKVMKTIRIDGRDYEVGSDEHLAKLDEIRVTEVTAIQAKFDEASGQLAAVTKERDELLAKLDKATSQEHIDSLVSSRVELHTKARTILGPEEKLDGLTERAVMIRALRKFDAESPFEDEDEEEKKDSRFSNDYIRGMFEHTVKIAARTDSVDSPLDAAHRAAGDTGPKPPPASADAPHQKDKFDAKGARKDFMRRTEDAWKQPLSASKDN